MVRSLKGEATSASVRGMSDAVPGDLDDLIDVAGVSAGQAEPEIKKEPKSKEEITAEKVTSLVADPQPTLRKYQDFQTSIKSLLHKASTTKYTESLSETMQKHLTKLNRV
eukprot:4543108-Pyramimonas_sp.AAC.1